MNNILITGGAGFIGSNLIERILNIYTNVNVTCIDNFDNYYGKKIKINNIKPFAKNPRFKLVKGDIIYLDSIKKKLDSNYDIIIHLAAKAGVLPSINDPQSYTKVNILGTQNLLEYAKNINCKKFIFASSSSVYGINSKVPWTEKEYDLKPISPYASTKLSGELLGHVYSHLYNIQFIALRFFNVYGPKQRPDLAISKFITLIKNNKTITIYGDGSTRRDYTHIDDIVDGIINCIKYDKSLYEVFNLGNNHPISINEVVRKIEKYTSKKAQIKYIEEKPGDIPLTYADIKKAKRLLNYNPKTSIDKGIEDFIKNLDRNEN